MGFHCGSAGKESACNAGNLGSIPGLGRSPREGKGYQLQYSGLENSMDCIAYGVAKSQTWLSDFNSNVNIICCTWKLTRGICLILNWYKICCCYSVTKSCLTLCNSMNCNMPCFLCFTISWSLPKFMSIVLKMPSNHHSLCHPLLFLPSISHRISLFQWVHLCIKWSKYWSSVSASVLPMNIQNWFPLKLPGLISLQSKGLSESSPAPQLEGIKVWCSAFFMVQLSHLYMAPGKTMALTLWTFVNYMMSLLFNTWLGLSLLSSKGQASFNFMGTVTVRSDFGVQENKICHCFHFSSFVKFAKNQP